MGSGKQINEQSANKGRAREAHQIALQKRNGVVKMRSCGMCQLHKSILLQTEKRVLWAKCLDQQTVDEGTLVERKR